ncbi:MAG: flagellar biosynthesis protein FlhF [Pirellulales bacterium]|nr:flagellar biosynthesis protein FlhF [Pirellulales bacterium]
MSEALAMVRRELGPDAAILQTRRRRGILGWVPGGYRVEVTASVNVNVPSRFATEEPSTLKGASATDFSGDQTVDGQAANLADIVKDGSRSGSELQGDLQQRISDLQSMVNDLCQQSAASGRQDVPQELFQLYADLIESEIPEELARQYVERIRATATPEELADPLMVKAHVGRIVESELCVHGPIKLEPGRRRIVALVGPTGVGKTTTIAKLAANFRLRDKRKVGLITVDTYRIAAVEQLRTYADIIDLPMQVVSSPREMREAAGRMSGMDLILMDTAGRSPRDEVKIHELKAFLDEAQATDVHLVLSAVTGANTLVRTAERFKIVGAGGLILTKLDEATAMGNLLPLLRSGDFPLRYVTNGQNVPDDIEAAEAHRLTNQMLDTEETTPSPLRQWS